MNAFPMPFYQFLKKPTNDQIDQLIILYKEAQWWSDGADSRKLIEAIVNGSHCFCVAVDGPKIIAMGRAISDGVSDAYIQDVTVAIAFRHRGIATRLVTAILERLEKEGIGWVGLIAERGSAGFYEPLGFSPMPNSTPMLRLRKL